MAGFPAGGAMAGAGGGGMRGLGSGSNMHSNAMHMADASSSSPLAPSPHLESVFAEETASKGASSPPVTGHRPRPSIGAGSGDEDDSTPLSASPPAHAAVQTGQVAASDAAQEHPAPVVAPSEATDSGSSPRSQTRPGESPEASARREARLRALGQ